MYENIRAAVASKKAIALASVEPLDCTCEIRSDIVCLLWQIKNLEDPVLSPEQIKQNGSWI